MFLAEIIVDFIFLLLVLGMIVLLAYGVYSFHTGAPFVPTSRKRVAIMISLANPKPGEKILDLGSGDGRIVLTASQTGAECLGIEINPALYHWSKLKAFLKRSKNVSFKRSNFWNYNLEEIDVMFIYFINTKMERLAEKIKKEMKPGSRIISHGFVFPNWQYQTKDGNIYLYIV